MTYAAQLPRTTRRWRAQRVGGIVGLVGLALAVGAGLASVTGHPSRPTAVAIGVSPRTGEEAIVLSSGTLDIRSLRTQLERTGAGAGAAAVTMSAANTVELQRPLVVLERASLQVRDTTVRLVSTAAAMSGIEVVGGKATVQASEISSWNPAANDVDHDPADGRAFVLARDGGTLDIRGSTLRDLGFDKAESYGVSYRTGAGGRVAHSQFTGNWYGLYTHQARPMKITDSVVERSVSYGLDIHSASDDFEIRRNTLRQNGKHGLTFAGGSHRALVDGNVMNANGAHGIAVVEGSSGAELRNNRVFDNAESGLKVSSSTAVVVTGLEAWGNGYGMEVTDGASDVELRDSALRANRDDGLKVNTLGFVSVYSSRFDHNGQAGIAVDNGNLRVSQRSRMAFNVSGVRLTDRTSSLQVVDASIERNYVDGLNLASLVGVDVRASRLLDNGKGAVSLPSKPHSVPFLTRNLVRQRDGSVVRVRGAENEADAGLDQNTTNTTDSKQTGSP
jgi:hypothetical protein